MNKSRLFNSKSEEPFKLSRTKIEMFLGCPRCFYLDRVHGVGRPSGPAFTLNVAVATYTKEGLKFQIVLGPLKFERSRRGGDYTSRKTTVATI